MQSWWRFFAFPRLVLLTQARGGKISMAELIQRRIEAWSTLACREEMLQKAKERSSHGRKKEVASRTALWAQGKRKDTPEKSIIRALRAQDVSKALRLLCSAPLADKGPETLSALRKLHPVGPGQLLFPFPGPSLYGRDCRPRARSRFCCGFVWVHTFPPSAMFQR